MTHDKVIVVKTGTANLASVCAGLRRAGMSPVIVDACDEIVSAKRLVLPGVGAFDAAMAHLEQKDMVSPLRDRIAAGKPTLAICLGLQLFCEGSEESRGRPGLGVVQGEVTKLKSNQRIPQMGWNRISPTDQAKLLRPGYGYFANSYCLEKIPEGWSGATTTYGGTFAAAIEKGSVLACQFHPELSSNYGAGLIDRWLACGEEEDPVC